MSSGIEPGVRAGLLLDESTHPCRRRPPVRIVHLGLGAFHRAHQAWYTMQADPDREWGIAAFTGRRPEAAERLNAQDGLYTLVERGRDSDSFSVVEVIVEARHGGDHRRLRELVAAPSTAIITLTVTEPGYLLAADGELDASSDAVLADLTVLRQLGVTGWKGEGPATTPGRLVSALQARRESGAGPLAVVGCDNLSRNGSAARRAVVGMAALLDPALAEWISDAVSFVDTSVDRITPRTTDDDLGAVLAATGLEDRAPVVTEPFSSWVLAGEFPAGRPAWERAGAVFVSDIEPFERRKLWLLNGAHSLLAYAGLLRGHRTVYDALQDPECAAWVEELWDEASEHLTAPGLDLTAYRRALLERFSNPRIAHHLDQIAADGVTKLRMRAVPIIRAERSRGRRGSAAARMIAAWIGFVSLTDDASHVTDAQRDAIAAALHPEKGDRVAALVSLLDADLIAQPDLVGEVAAHLEPLGATRLSGGPSLKGNR